MLRFHGYLRKSAYEEEGGEGEGGGEPTVLLDSAENSFWGKIHPNLFEKE